MTATSPLMDRVVSHFDHVKPNGTGFMVSCPGPTHKHGDRHPSLHISLGRDGEVLMKCQAGCETADILAAKGLDFPALFPSNLGPRLKTWQDSLHVETVYDYVDEDGNLLHQTVRRQYPDRKEFTQRRPDGKGGHIYSLNGSRVVPFRLDKLVSEPINRMRFVAEGEEDVLKLEEHGFLGTCNPMGAGSWRADFASYFAGCMVPIIADNDPQGRQHAAKVAQSLHGVAAEIRIIELPDLPEKEDVSYFFKKGGTSEQLRAIVKLTPSWQPTEETINHTDNTDKSDATASPNSGDIIWPDLQDLPPLAAVPTLPAEMVPDPLRAWLFDTADIARIPLEMVAAPAIVALSSVVGRSVGIQPWKFNPYVTVPNLWGLVVTRPGWMKTYSVDEAISHVKRLAAQAQERFEEEKLEAEPVVAALEAEIDAIKSKMREAAKKDASLDELKQRYREKLDALKSAKPVERRYLTHDATVEKLGELLRENPRGMLVVRDELYGLLRSFDKSGRETDRQFYLEAWGGTGSFTSDRIARGTIHVPNMTLSIIGGIQPGRLRPLVEDAANAGGGDDGLLQRFQLFVWPDQLEPWRRADRWPDGPARDRARSIYERLDRVIPSDVDAARDREDGIPYTSFTPNAQIIADRWHDQLEHRLRTGELDATPAFASHISKYRSLMPSLALLFHLVDIADGKVSPGPVGEAPTRLAADWCEFLELHARKLYDVELDKGKAAARALAAKIKNGALIDGKPVREIYRSQWSGLTTDDIVFDGLNVLQSLGWVRIDSISNGGRASQIVRLHPGLQQEQGHE